ncbi:MAG: inositol monophosphatase family protein [Planctomycetota bacterium]
MPTQHVPDEFVRLATRLAEDAHGYLRDAFPRRGEVEIKPDGTPVTPFDRGLEERLRGILAREAPSHGVLGEEFGAENADAEWVWVLDPIDGTKAFLTGKPTFGSLIALAHERVPVLGVIECPMTDERWIGGEGVPTRTGAGPTRVRDPRALEDCVMYGYHTFHMEPDRRAGLDRLRRAVRFPVHDTDCFGYGRLASGDIDLVVEPGLAVHDHAALAPVVRGAGGTLTLFDGSTPTIDAGGDIIAATSPEVARAALALL